MEAENVYGNAELLGLLDRSTQALRSDSWMNVIFKSLQEKLGN